MGENFWHHRFGIIRGFYFWYSPNAPSIFGPFPFFRSHDK